MTAVFADTFYWIAFIYPVDRHAKDARRFDNLLSDGNMYTTEKVLGEVLTSFADDRWLRSRAVEPVREILSDPAVHVILRAMSRFSRASNSTPTRPDKEYSLVDCISMQAMRKEGLTKVLTNDHHFDQEGFRALFRDS